MRNSLNILLIIAFVFSLVSPIVAVADDNFVRLNLEVDNKRVQEKFKLLFYVNGVEIESLKCENGFVVPSELENYDKVNVRVIFRNYDLLFEAVPISAFKYDWIIGVDLKPFDPDHIDLTEKPPNGKKLIFIYYIHYVARTSEQADTNTIIKIYN